MFKGAHVWVFCVVEVQNATLSFRNKIPDVEVETMNVVKRRGVHLRRNMAEDISDVVHNTGRIQGW